MKVFITGAGVSNGVDYPLGSELLAEIDSYVRKSGRCIDRFDYTNWDTMTKWFEENENLLIREAYATRNVELLFTALDFIEQLGLQKLGAVPTSLIGQRENQKAAMEAEASWLAYNAKTATHADYRRRLLWALEYYFDHKHRQDELASRRAEWDDLRSFGQKLCSKDILITFNYDSTVERVLLEQGRWHPGDGYGFKVVFQKSRHDPTPVEYQESPVKVLHLHGAVGWYPKPLIKDELSLLPDGGAIPAENLQVEPPGTEIALDPLFLESMGLPIVDASLPERQDQDRQILIHPSFLKNYEMGSQNRVFVHLWGLAAKALRSADEIFIIGYSLPEADSAALTLLVTTCAGKNVRIVNRNPVVNDRLNQLLAQTLRRPGVSLKEWLAEIPDCPSRRI